MAINFLNVGAFPDDVKLTFGAGSDLQIFHNATDSIIYNGTGALMLRGSDVRIQAADASATYLTLDSSEAAFTTDVRLSGSKKLYTWTGSNDNYITYNSWYIWTGSDIILRNSGTGPWKFQTNGANDVLTLDSSQNATFAGTVGIGIAAPTSTYSLRVDGNTLISSEKYHYFGGGNTGIGTDGSNNLVLRQDGADLMTTSGSNVTFAGAATFAGNVTLGSSSKVSDEWMYIDSDANSSAGIQLLRGGASKWFIYNPGGGNNFKIYDNVGGGYMEIEPVGNVTFSSNILTNTDSSSDIGTTSKRWANLWVDSINGGAVVSGSYLPLAGGTMTGNVIFNDNVQIRFGTSGAESYIYSDGSDTYYQGNSGNLWFYQAADDKDIIFSSDDGSGGVTEYFKVDGSETNILFSKNARFIDSISAQFGTDGDLVIKHDGDSKIDNFAGDLYIRNHVDDKDIYFECDDGSGGMETYFFLDGSVGYTVVEKDMRFNDNVSALFGTSSDMTIKHDGSNSKIENNTGHLYFIQEANDKSIYFQTDDGSGGTTTYMKCDGLQNFTEFPVAARFMDNVKLQFGNSNDGDMYHNGTDMLIRNHVDDGDLSLVCDDGSGGTTSYFSLDGGVAKSRAYKDINFEDNVKATFGNVVTPDLDIYSDGNNGIISTNGASGSLYITQNVDDEDIYFQADNGSGGVTTYFFLDGSQTNIHTQVDFRIYDNKKLQLGNGADLEIYHDGSHSEISEVGTGDLRIRGDSVWILESDGTNQISAYQGTAKLYKDGNEKLSTTSTGVTITGDATVTGDITIQGGDILNSSGAFTITSAGDFIVDAVGDIKLDADGGDWYFRDAGSNILVLTAGGSSSPTFAASQQDADIIFTGNDGGSTITALTLDMSEAGYATFNSGIAATTGYFTSTVNVAGPIYHIGDTDTYFGFSAPDTFIVTTSGTTALTINSSQGAAFTGKATSAATVDGDGSTTMATKGWVESKLTGATLYQGTWDPDKSLNSGYGNPNLSSASLQVNGYYYICSADGIAEPNGTGTEPDSWHTGDWVIWNDDVGSGEWQKIDNTTVLSGAGTGEYLARWTDTETLGDSVVLASGDDILIPRYIGHVGDTNTYFGFSGNDTIQFNTNSNERMRIISSGEVGIGTSTPQTNLQVTNKISVTTGGAYRMYNAAGTGWGEMNFNEVNNRVEFNRGINNSGSDWLLSENAVDSYVCANEGDFGIGTTSPGNKLHIVSGDEDTLRLESTSGQPAIFWYPGGTVKWEQRASASLWQLYSYDESEWVFNLSYGNCGIGTTGPLAKLDISTSGNTAIPGLDAVPGASTSAVFRNSGNTVILAVGVDNANTSWLQGRQTTGTGSAFDIALNPLGGDVGIGTATPSEKLEVDGIIKTVHTDNTYTKLKGTGLYFNRSNSYLIAENDNSLTLNIGADGARWAHTRINSATVKFENGATEYMRVTSSGDLGIGTTTPDAKLEVNGGIIAGGKTTYTLSWGSLDTTGQPVAGLSGESGGNGQSAGFIFTCFGGDGYQRIVYSCKNVGGTWDINKDIDEGVNALDVTYAADGSDNITFTFKARSSTQSFTPKVTVEAIGTYINQSYIN